LRGYSVFMSEITLSTNVPWIRDEEHKLLYDLNSTSMEYPRDKSLMDLFEEQVIKTPGSTALIFGDTEYSYQQLNSISNQLGHYLRHNYQVKPDDLLGVMLERSDWMIIAILGIMKAGAAYVPIDPDYPEERLKYIMNDSDCKVLINEQELYLFNTSRNDYSAENPVTGLHAGNLVYCIYTSGSTGNPKGVLVEHRNVVNLLWGQKQFYNITPDERVLQFSTITFDPSAEQIWIAFITGAALVVISKTVLLDVKALENYIIEKKISHIHTVPAYMAELSIKDMSSVKRVITGGESCSPSLAEKWKSYCTFINEYGPTETTITSIEYKAEASGNHRTFIPIGKPVANTQIYVFDEQQKLVPFGEIGEIYIGGDGVTRGYHKRPELTAEKFIENPYKTGDRIYRTGDLGRWMEDGNMEYLGRIDDQVKIRGYRIELDEISSVLLKHPGVNAAVVIARAVKSTDKELIAYTTGNAASDELNEHLKKLLPSYMVPPYFVHMEALPLTHNGKIDKKALPLPDVRYQKQKVFKAPVTALEKTIADIWRNILAVEEISVDDDFFDLGGNSLMAVRVISQVNRQTKSHLGLTGLYQLSTIRQLAGHLESNDTGEANPVILLRAGEGTPLFIFPPWSSYPTIFDEFVKNYAGKNPLYGIIYTEDSDDFPFKNLQEYAKYLITNIKRLHPTGPYALIGYSLGGRTILEIAIQLEQNKDQIEMLAVVSHFPAFPPKGILLSRRVRDEIRVFNQISIPLKLKYLNQRFPYFLKLLVKGNNDIQEIKVEIDTQKSIFNIHEAYEPKSKYHGELLLIYETNPDGDASEYKKVQVYRNSIFKKLWAKYVMGNIITKIVECRHIDFFKDPAVKKITAIVESHLK
jgi:amino acid adenylation domain-containing protein